MELLQWLLAVHYFRKKPNHTCLICSSIASKGRLFFQVALVNIASLTYVLESDLHLACFCINFFLKITH